MAKDPDARAVAEAARDLDRELSPEQAEGLARYLGPLMRWNARMNLVGARDWRGALADLAADSWRLADFLAEHLHRAPALTLDLGAGAGLPGLPLRLFYAAGDYHLVEPRAKRAAFLRYALGAMGLSGVFVCQCRVEDLPAELAAPDLVVSRAFLPWPALLELVAGRFAPGCRVAVMSGDRRPKQAEAPGGWQLAGQLGYQAGRARRYVSLFTPARSSI